MKLRRFAADSPAEAPMVFCGRVSQDVSLVECSECKFCGGLYLDASERGTFLRCRGGPRSPARAVPRAEPAPKGRHVTATVGELMTRAVATVTADTSVDSLVTLLLERGISAVPVVDADDKPIGIVSKTDLLRRYYDDGGTGEATPSAVHTADGVELDLGGGFHTIATGDASVADVMTPRVLTLPEDANVGQAAAVMSFEGVHRVLIVTAEGAIAGILSSLDVLRWVASDTGFVVPEVGHVRTPKA